MQAVLKGLHSTDIANVENYLPHEEDNFGFLLRAMQVNWMPALERWRESGIAPDRLTASRVGDNHVNMTRPICSYPAVAKYNGVGSTNDAANFVCKVP